MTTVSGIIRDTQGNALPGLDVTIRYKRPLVGYNGGAAVQNSRAFTTDGDGLLTMPDLVPGHYDFFVSIQANAASSGTLLQNGTLVVLTEGPMTLEAALDSTIGEITPTILQQAAASASAAQQSAEEAALYDGPRFDTVTDFFSSTATFAAGTYVRTDAEGFAYRAVDTATAMTVANAGGQAFEVIWSTDKGANLLAFGPAKDGVTDDSDQIEKWLAVGGGIAPAGTYAHSRPIVLSNGDKLIGANRSWSTGQPGLTVFKWIGAADGVMLQASKEPLGTPNTSALTAVQIKNFALDGDNVAGVGAFLNYFSNASRIENVTAIKCNLFGFLMGKMWFSFARNLNARSCDGIGIAIGENYLNTFDDPSVNGIGFENLSAHRCGQAYNATTAPTGFDLTDNPTGGCGILIRSKTNSSYTNLQAELCYGPGVTLHLRGPVDGGIDGMYLERNSVDAVTDGAISEKVGLLVNNSVSAASTFKIDRFFGDGNSENYNVHYIDDGGSTFYDFGLVRSFGIIGTGLSGVIPVRVDEQRLETIPDGVYLDKASSLNGVRFTPEGGGESINRTGAIEIYPGVGSTGWASGASLGLGTVRLDTQAVGRGVSASLIVQISAQAASGSTISVYTGVYLVHVIAGRRFFGAIDNSFSAELISEHQLNAGANLVTVPTPTVSFADETTSVVNASIQIAPTSTGTQADNFLNVNMQLLGSGTDGGSEPKLSALLGV